MTATVPVLMYHSICADPPRSTRRLAVHPDVFRAQLGFLAEQGFTPVPFSRLAAAHDGGALPARPVVLTFDDGYADFAHVAFPLLAAAGWPATLFVTTGWIADERRRAGRPLDATLGWGQLEELAAAGIEIGAHGHSHAPLDQLPGAQLASELRESRALLEDRLAAPVPTLAYPFGHSSPRVRRAAREAGYVLAAAVANRRTGPDPDPFAVPRLTVGPTTTADRFAHVLTRDTTARVYWRERMLTAGYRPVRRARALARGVLRG